MSDLFSQNKKIENYSSEDIIVLEGLEPVRKRPGMYIGGTDEKALHHLVIEVLDNAIDEAVAGYANLIEIEQISFNTIKISDNGRGIPIDPHPKYPNKSALEVIMTTLHSGGKFTDKNYYRHTGYPGGIKKTNPTLLIKSKPDQILKLAVKRMLPGGPLAKKQLSKLKIYKGGTHPHESQKIKIVNFAKMNKKNYMSIN